MTILRENVGDVGLSMFIYRDGEKLTTSGGESDLREYIKTVEIYESITSSTIEASIVIEDSGGLIGSLTGSELIKLNVIGTIIDRTFFLRSYEISSRSRTNQTSDVYILNLASDEFMKNEVINIFGNSNVVFKDAGTETSQIIKKIIRDKKYLNSGKKLFLEETLNQHSFVAPNWRPFDTIYWLCHRSIRKTQKSGSYQNGFAFYENALGYHFQSIDKMIENINSQTNNPTKITSDGVSSKAEPRLYSYSQTPKNTGDGTQDQFTISKIVFPQEKNFLMGLRHGTWSGYSIGFDPVTISQSKMGLSTDMSVDAYRYSLNETWSKMSHLKGGSNANPIQQMDKTVQNLVNYPKRVRYTILPNQVFDPKYQNQPQKNYEELVELQAYQWMRMEALKSIKLQIEVPGNLDLYAGSGIDIVIAGTFKSADKVPIDERYSGRYLIASLTHKILGSNMVTELLLMKDSTI